MMLLKTTELSLLRILEYWNTEILAQNTAILDGGRLRSFLRRMLGGQRRKGEHCGMIDVHGRAQTIMEDKNKKNASTLKITRFYLSLSLSVTLLTIPSFGNSAR